MREILFHGKRVDNGEWFHGNLLKLNKRTFLIPHNYDEHFLIPHGKKVLYVERNFNDIKDFLKNNYIEGIVFWLNGQPVCKIKRSDFGFNWG